MTLRQVIRRTKIEAKLPPELIPTQFGSNPTDLLGFADSNLIEIIVYLVSNNMVYFEDMTHVLKGFQAHQDHKLLRHLLSSQDITAESTVANLVKYAFNTGNARMAGTILSSHRTVASNLDPQKLINQACKHQDLELVKIAIELGASIAAVALNQVLYDIQSLAISTLPGDRQLGRVSLDLDFLKYLMNHGSCICCCDTDQDFLIRESCLAWALVLGNLNLVELLLSPDWKAKQCPKCFEEAVLHIPSTTPDCKQTLHLFLAAGVNIALSVAIHCQSIDAMRRILSRKPVFSKHDLASVCVTGDLHFILGALELYHRIHLSKIFDPPRVNSSYARDYCLQETLSSEVSLNPVVSAIGRPHTSWQSVFLYELNIETVINTLL